MSDQAVREELNVLIDLLSEEQAAALLHVARVMVDAPGGGDGRLFEVVYLGDADDLLDEDAPQNDDADSALYGGPINPLNVVI